MENFAICSDKYIKLKDEIMNGSKEFVKENPGNQDKNNSNFYHSTIVKLALLTKNLQCSFSIADGDACVSKLSVEGLDILCTRLGKNCSFKRVDGFADGTYRVVIDCQMIIKANFGFSLSGSSKPIINNNCNLLIYNPCELKIKEQPKELSINLEKDRIEKKIGKTMNIVQPIIPRSPKDSLKLKRKTLKNPRGRPKEIGTHSFTPKVNLANILPKLAPSTSPASMKMVLISKSEVSRNEQFVDKSIVGE